MEYNHGGKGDIFSDEMGEFVGSSQPLIFQGGAESDWSWGWLRAKYIPFVI